MYCSNCGTKNKDNKFCVNCGNKLDLVIENNVNKDNNGMKNASIILGVLGIISSMMIVFSPIGLILSIVGLILAICATKKIKNVLGIVLNALSIGL